jgi:hypothetical protein
MLMSGFSGCQACEQVLDHFEWRYLTAFDMAIANTVPGSRPPEDDVSLLDKESESFQIQTQQGISHSLQRLHAARVIL